MNTAVTFDPTAATEWLGKPIDVDVEPTGRAGEFDIDDWFGHDTDGFLAIIRDLLLADPDGLLLRGDVDAVSLWLIPDGDYGIGGALITVDLANGLRLCSLHEDIKDFVDRDERGITAALSALTHVARQASLLVTRYHTARGEAPDELEPQP